MAQTVDELRQELAMNEYTPRTDEQLQSAAEAKFGSVYGQQRLSAQQAYDTADLALSNQLNSLNLSYNKQREQAQEATRRSVSSMDRYSLQRGMQRSSYNAATLANIMKEGNDNLTDIGLQEAAARNNIESQRTQLAQQLGQQLAQYDTDYVKDLQAYIEEMRQQDYERQNAQDQYLNQLRMALYEYGLKSGGGSSGGGSRSSSTSYNYNTQNPDPVTPPSNNDPFGLNNAFSGNPLRSNISNSLNNLLGNKLGVSVKPTTTVKNTTQAEDAWAAMPEESSLGANKKNTKTNLLQNSVR